MSEEKHIRIYPLRCGSIRVSPKMAYGGELGLRGAAEMALAVIVALLYTLLSALAALALGLKMPNLTWTNEITPIKQSACVALSLFGGWAVAMIPGALYLLTGIGSLDPLLYLSVVTALLLILSAVLSLWVKKTGSRIFASL